jgi:AcrR family transcriptional regulator
MPPRHKREPLSQKEVGLRRRAATRHALLSAAFELLGRSLGTSLRVEEICAQANVVRTTFYNHFDSVENLVAVITDDMSHDFNVALHKHMEDMAEPEQRLAFGVRLYLRRARLDRSWGCAMVNIGFLQGAGGNETDKLMSADIKEGLRAGTFTAKSERAACDAARGAGVGGMISVVSGETPEDYPEQIVFQILRSLGLSKRRAEALTALPLDDFMGSDIQSIPRLSSVKTAKA